MKTIILNLLKKIYHKLFRSWNKDPKSSFPIEIDFKGIRTHQELILKDIKNKHSDGKKIVVGFFVVYDSVFPAMPLFKGLLANDNFDPRLILIPEVMRGRENMINQIDKSWKSFSEFSDRLTIAYDRQSDSYQDIANDLDLICMSNPYDSLVHDFHSLKHLGKKNVLPFYISYGFTVSNYSRHVIAQAEMSYHWKIFVPTNDNKEEYRNFAKRGDENVVVIGYCKMDELAQQSIIPRARKRIILAPHHTVREWKDGLQISSFLLYSEYLLALSDLYSQIDFIFRPHPLLRLALESDDIWGKEKTEKYFSEICNKPNVRFSDEHDYMPTFANSDALIHDCGSFVAEYLFTGKPACFISVEGSDIYSQFSPVGKKCLDHHYHARSEKAIGEFIENVVLSGEDLSLHTRQAFAETELKINYPDVSGVIIKFLESEVLNDH